MLALVRELELPPNDLHVWPISLDAEKTDLTRLRGLLSAEELERAAKFRFDRDRRRFEVGRGALRILLGRYLSRPPETIGISYDGNGKPQLEDGNSLRFNLSHSEEAAVMAFVRHCEIGVDLEAIRSHPDFDQIVTRFFCADECRDYLSLPLEQRAQGFYSCWTRKEAYSKAIGAGWSLPGNQFRVTLRPDEKCRLVCVDSDPREAGEWTLRSIELGPGHACAVACRSRQKSLEVANPLSAYEIVQVGVR